jgi:hypothetical protein
MKDLEDILSGRETAPVEDIKEVATEAKAEEVAQEAPEAPTEELPEGQTTVPVAALQAERQKAKTYREQVAAFEQRLAEQNSVWENRLNQLFSSLQTTQPKQEEPKAPDFWEAPETAIDYRLNQTVAPLAGQLQQMREDFSKMQAIDKHGQQTVDAAFNELAQLRTKGDPSFAADYQRIMSSPHPYGTLVEWHRKRQVAAEIGDDPTAYKEKLKAELLAELQASPPPSSNTPAASVMPSNFATSRNVGSRSGPAWSGPQSIGDIFKR